MVLLVPLGEMALRVLVALLESPGCHLALPLLILLELERMAPMVQTEARALTARMEAARTVSTERMEQVELGVLMEARMGVLQETVGMGFQGPVVKLVSAERMESLETAVELEVLVFLERLVWTEVLEPSERVAWMEVQERMEAMGRAVQMVRMVPMVLMAKLVRMEQQVLRELRVQMVLQDSPDRTEEMVEMVELAIASLQMQLS